MNVSRDLLRSHVPLVRVVDQRLQSESLQCAVSLQPLLGLPNPDAGCVRIFLQRIVPDLCDHRSGHALHQERHSCHLKLAVGIVAALCIVCPDLVSRPRRSLTAFSYSNRPFDWICLLLYAARTALRGVRIPGDTMRPSAGAHEQQHHRPCLARQQIRLPGQQLHVQAEHSSSQSPGNGMQRLYKGTVLHPLPASHDVEESSLPKLL